jgi:hypothetical protein
MDRRTDGGALASLSRIPVPLLIFGAAIGLSGLFAPVVSLANGLGENRSWQFSAPYERAQKAGITALIEQKKGGGFRYNYYTNNTTTFNVDGDYVDCGVSANTTGNTNGSSQSSTVGSPSVGVSPGFSSLAQGNVNDAVVGGDGSNLNAAGDGSGNPSSSATQDNTAAQTATVDSNTVQATIGTSSGSGTGGSLAINSDQSNDGAVLNADVTSSTACSFAGGASGGAP